jgi:hypothetical protein
MTASLFGSVQSSLGSSSLPQALDLLAKEAQKSGREKELPEAITALNQWYSDQVDTKRKPQKVDRCSEPACVGPRQGAPKRPGVKSAWQGRFVEKVEPPKRDPLILELMGIVPGAKITIRNRSDLTKGAKDTITLPGDTKKFTGDGGYYNIVLSAEWLEKNCIRPGDILEIRQEVKGEKSDPAVVPTNLRPANAPQTYGSRAQPLSINLPPGDRIDLNETVTNFFALDPDPRPPQVDPSRFTQDLCDGKVTVEGLEAVEPSAMVSIDNVAKMFHAQPTKVSNDGRVTSSIQADKGDPMVIRVVDHSNPNGGNVLAERRLTMVAGVSGAVLARNPALGIDGTPEIALSRFEIDSVNGQGRLSGKASITEGSLITITNMTTGETHRTAADAKGSFAIDGDFKLGDVLDITAANPFSDAPSPHGGTMKCLTKLRATVAEKGGTCGLELDTMISGDASRVIDKAVKPHGNVDDLKSLEPEGHPVAVEPTGLNFSNNCYGISLKTSSGFVLGDVSLGFDVSASAKVDEAAQKIVLTVDAHGKGGWPSKGESSAWVSAMGESPNVTAGEPKSYQVEIRDQGGKLIAKAKADASRTVSYGSYMPSSRGVSAFYERAPAGWSAPRYESLAISFSDLKLA